MRARQTHSKSCGAFRFKLLRLEQPTGQITSPAEIRIRILEYKFLGMRKLKIVYSLKFTRKLTSENIRVSSESEIIKFRI